jgi:hypothetical protein
LLLAFGITKNWNKIAVIDTEDSSASLFHFLGPFNTLQISEYYSPLSYVEAIQLCEQSQIEVIIIDSISPEWIGQMGVIDEYCSYEGDRFKRWSEVIKRHWEFTNSIVYSKAHIIATVRIVEGKPQAEQGYEHYFTTVLSMNKQYVASVVKDRTSVCKNLCPTIITMHLGEKLKEWCEMGGITIPESLLNRINACKSINQLYSLLIKEEIPVEFISAFTKRRLELEGLSQAA